MSRSRSIYPLTLPTLRECNNRFRFATPLFQIGTMRRHPRPDYQLYGDAMSMLGFGIPLWQPAPLPDYAKVNIGDVGYVRRGCFHLLFSAASSPTGKNVPKNFVPLDIGLVVPLQARKPGPIYTADIKTIGGSAGLSLNLPTTIMAAGAKFSFQSNTTEGATLVTKHKTKRDDAQYEGRFKAYMLANYKSWIEFANDLSHGGHDIEVKDLLFVTGRDMTEDFSMLAFSHNERGMNLDFNLGAASAWGSWSTQFPVFENWGPQAPEPDVDELDLDAVIAAPRNEVNASASPDTTAARPEFRQCVFLRGFRVKRRIKFVPKVMKAAAGPDELDPEDRDGECDYVLGIDVSDFDGLVEGFSSLSSTRSSSPSDDAMAYVNVPKFRDPTIDRLAEYIFENSDAELAILHDKDWINVTKAANATECVRCRDVSTIICALSPKFVTEDEKVVSLDFASVGPNGKCLHGGLDSGQLSRRKDGSTMEDHALSSSSFSMVTNVPCSSRLISTIELSGEAVAKDVAQSTPSIGPLSLFNQHLQQKSKSIEWIYSDSAGEGTKTTPIWVVRAMVDGQCLGRGRGTTKKVAKNEAAKEGLKKLGQSTSLDE